MEDESALIRQFMGGDCGSFEKLIAKYYRGAVRFAESCIHDGYMAEDIAQESFADIYVNRHKYRDQSFFKTYLYTIVKHKCLDHLRKRRHLPLDDAAVCEESRITMQEPVEKTVLDGERMDMVRKALHKLKAEYRAVICLIAYEGFSYEETARIMCKSPGQVKIMVHRARKKLKAMLDKEV